MESDEKLDRVFTALADQRRRQILNTLTEGPMTVSELASQLATAVATVSKNISLLEKAELLYKIKKGRTVYCHMNHDTWLELAVYVSGLAHFWQNRLNDLETYVQDSKNRQG